MTPAVKQRWLALSPLLDELLDLDATARAQRLDELAAQDPVLASELRGLLQQEETVGAPGLLDQPVAEALRMAPPPASIEVAGQAIGPYRLERELGQGGMGSVWTAQRADGRFEGRVAVKFLKAGLFAAGDAGRFAREGQILARLAHPHIARLLDAGVERGQPYLVLEFVDGQPLDAWCREQGLGIEARVRLFLDVLAAVGHAHTRLILHRDLKPSNILVTRDGEVKLLDFGIAKLLDDAGQGGASTELTQLAGHAYTPQYAAPEQVQQTEVTTATDVYALGVLLYQLLGGGHPTAAETQMRLDLLKAVVEQVPRRLSEAAQHGDDPQLARQARQLRGDLDTIVAKALKKLPAERYANAQALADDLQRWLAHEPISARPDSRLYVLGRFVRRHRLAVAAGTAALLLLMASTATSLLQARRAEAAEQQAQARRQQAEDLLSYMLGDFADKLRPIGRLELLDSVGSKALAFLAQEPDAAAAARLQQGKALTVIGEVRVSKRELEAALEPLQAANALLQGDPPSPDKVAEWRKAQGAAAFWLGHVHYAQRKFEPAQQAWQRYRALSEQWLQALPQDSQARVELSYAENSLGSLALAQGRLPEAERAFRQSMALKEQVLKERPDDATLQGDWADSASWLGTALSRSGRYRGAIALFETALSRVLALRDAHPDDLRWLSHEVNFRFFLGMALHELGDPRASAQQQQAEAEAQTLTQGDPANRTWALMAIEASAERLRQPGSEASARARQAQALLARIDGLRPGKGPLDTWLPRVVKLLELTLPADCRAEQCRALDEPLARAEERLAAAMPRSPGNQQLLNARVMLAQMRAGLVQADPTAAREQCQRAADLLAGQGGWMQVHAELTRRWVRVQECLDPRAPATPDMLAARDWLQQQLQR